MKPLNRFKRSNSCAYASRGWVLIESLISLLLFALIISVLNQQNESDFDQIRVLKAQAANQDVSSQILKLRRLKQDYEWLEGEFETGQESACVYCADESLKTWFLSWAQTGGVITFSSTHLLLGVDE
jgi:hypothetical protein